MKHFLIGFFGFAVIYGVAVVSYQKNQATSLQSYGQGCHDSLNDLYTRLGIKDVDQDSLNEHCNKLLKKYSVKKRIKSL